MDKKHKKLKIISATILILVFSVLGSSALAGEINPENVIKLVNQARDNQGLAMLNENSTLDKIATDKLNDMIAKSYFAHTSPQGVSPWTWYQKENYDYKYAGENLAINFITAEDQQKAWMASLTHRKNILNVNYQEIGVAVGAGNINGQTSIITVQEFGSRIGEAQTLNDQKNFSGSEKTNLIQNSQKIGPMVLSVKDITSGDGTGIGNTPANASRNDFLKTIRDAFSRSSGLIFYNALLINLLLLIVVLVMSPAIFVFLAFSLVTSAPNKNSIMVRFKDNINEIKLIKIHLI